MLHPGVAALLPAPPVRCRRDSSASLQASLEGNWARHESSVYRQLRKQVRGEVAAQTLRRATGQTLRVQQVRGQQGSVTQAQEAAPWLSSLSRGGRGSCKGEAKRRFTREGVLR